MGHVMLTWGDAAQNFKYQKIEVMVPALSYQLRDPRESLKVWGMDPYLENEDDNDA